MPPDQHPTILALIATGFIAVLPSLVKEAGEAAAKIIAALKRGRR